MGGKLGQGNNTGHLFSMRNSYDTYPKVLLLHITSYVVLYIKCYAVLLYSLIVFVKDEARIH